MPLGNNFYSSSKKNSKKIFKTEKKSKKLLVERYDEDSTRLLVTRLVMLSNISFFIISVFINHAVFDYPSSFKALHRPQGVRIGELEAIRRKYVNFLDFDFFLILLYGKKKTEKYKKIFGRFSEPMFTTFWSYKVDMLILICIFFYISFFKYNTDGI